MRLFSPTNLASLLMAMTTIAVTGSCGGAVDDEETVWTDADSMPTNRGEVAAAVGHRDRGCDAPPCDVVAVVGGYSFPAITQNRVDGYLPDEDRWIELPNFPQPRHHPAAAGLPDGTIVVSGGAPSATDEQPRHEVWALGSDADEWESLDSLPEPRWGHRMVAIGNRLITVGGHGGDTSFVWRPDDGWTPAAPIPMRRNHLGAVVVDDRLWAIGGRDPEFTSRVDIYDPADDTWSEGPALPEPTSAAAVGVVDNHLVVVSGEEYGGLAGGIIDAAWMLDLSVEEPDRHWEPLVEPPVHVHGAGDAVVGEGDDERLLILGGASWHAQWSVLTWTNRVQILHEPRRAPD